VWANLYDFLQKFNSADNFLNIFTQMKRINPQAEGGYGGEKSHQH